METDLRKLNWSPDTCACEIEITKEETRIVGHDEFPATEKLLVENRLTFLERSADGQSFVYRLPRHETVRTNKAGTVLEKTVHEQFEVPPPPGTRLRGTVVLPCPEHQGFSGVVQTQRVRCPAVCDCVWQELIIGQRKEGGYFGAIIERVCAEHIDTPLADIRDVVNAASRELSTV